ncbi:YesN/AraC family two-component response regulator [Natronobacillus azotifigens]|uniref:AraC family transcriptional regulator n=1 Tax=Natronobacillus azotifigens TaxID=472978 RepID=A0A9J6RB59_9BACI|nr:AraC family transcriptional regulator [Natronobacillus azotifigens]MCZ0702912.1 AraC family transcriptional regulator [Natronobacillus azotifigens]
MTTSIIGEKVQFELNYNVKTKTENSFHSHIEYEIYYFHKGKSRYLIGDKIYSLSPGDIIIMHGLTLHCAKTFEDEDYVRTSIHFDSKYYKEVLRMMGMEVLLVPFTTLQSYRVHLHGDEQEEFENLLKKMNEHNKMKNEVSPFRVQVCFVEMLTLIYTYFKKALDNKKDNKVSSGKMGHVQEVISFIDKNYMEEISLNRLEQELHISKFYLSKVFKEATGFTIFNYLYHRRVNQAKVDFLMSSHVSVTDISYKVGFKHPAHFSKVFKKITGVTPEEYKSLLQNSN